MGGWIVGWIDGNPICFFLGMLSAVPNNEYFSLGDNIFLDIKIGIIVFLASTKDMEAQFLDNAHTNN